MEQRCALVNVWLAWIGLPVLAFVVALRIGWIAALMVLVFGIVVDALYVRWFPAFSNWVGYGSVVDRPARGPLFPLPDPTRVTLYTANVCPFCPIVRKRLFVLKQTLGFDLKEVDVTFRPDIIRAKGLRSVPVVEANGRVLVGNATSQELAAFLGGAGAPSPQ